MEHRYSNRTPSDIRTLIYKNGLPAAIGRVRNMSRHGILIDYVAADVAYNQPLEVELLWPGRKAEHSGRFKCFVVRKEAQGIALCLFDECQPSYARWAESIMAAQRSSVAPSSTNVPQRNTNIGTA